MSNKIIIISGGFLADPSFLHNKIKDLPGCPVICCDGGVRHLLNSGIRPDVIIGDMDSIDPADLENFAAQGTKIIKYPETKDFTDTELALDYAIDLKPEEIFIWCALGGRLDHTLANVFLLCKGQEKGIKTYLMDEYSEAFVLDKEVSFANEKGKTVSLVALTPEVTGITLSGFLYSLQENTLIMGESRGISNMINDDRAVISIKKGKLLVVNYRQENCFPEVV